MAAIDGITSWSDLKHAKYGQPRSKAGISSISLGDSKRIRRYTLQLENYYRMTRYRRFENFGILYLYIYIALFEQKPKYRTALSMQEHFDTMPKFGFKLCSKECSLIRKCIES